MQDKILKLESEKVDLMQLHNDKLREQIDKNKQANDKNEELVR